MNNLSKFLLARIAEDEAVARAAHDNDLANAHMLGLIEGSTLSPGDRVMAHPTRVLAECEAKRGVVELHAIAVAEDWVNPVDGPAYREDENTCAICGWVRDACDTVKLLALPYASHRDYRAEWRP